MSSQDAAAKEMHNENKVMKKQLIGLLAKVTCQHLFPPPDASSVFVTSIGFDTITVSFHQIVGASREEVEDMGNS